MSEPLLQLEGVHTHIGQYHILQGVDLAVPRGALTVLLGRNGAGKTTTLRTIMGLWKPSRGRITFDGRDIGGLATPDIALGGVAYVPETMGVFSDLTVAENLRLAARHGAAGSGAARLDLRLLPGVAKVLALSGRRAVGRPEADAVDRARRGRAAHADPGRRADQGHRARDHREHDPRVCRS